MTQRGAGEERLPGRAEEITNSLTHGVGVALSITALVLLVVFASLHGDAWRVVTLSIYGATLVVLYLASTLYHALPSPKARRILLALDHSAIYLLIAGTYTPVTLVWMRGPWGWTLFGTVWGLAAAGIILRLVVGHRSHPLSIVLYLAMGWLVLVALLPLLRMAPMGLVLWLLIGGLCYSVGVVFYVVKKPFLHTVWHLFVLAGSICHFFGMQLYVVSATG